MKLSNLEILDLIAEALTSQEEKLTSFLKEYNPFLYDLYISKKQLNTKVLEGDSIDVSDYIIIDGDIDDSNLPIYIDILNPDTEEELKVGQKVKFFIDGELLKGVIGPESKVNGDRIHIITNIKNL